MNLPDRSITPLATEVPGAPADLLHGLAVRPGRMGWDGLRYQGDALADARLDDARAMAGVVATVRIGNFLGVVAMAPVHAQQAAVALAPVWRGMDAGASTPLPEAPAGDAFVWRPPRTDAPAGARAVAWCMEGHASLWLPACAPDIQALVAGEIAALLQLPVQAVRLFVLDGAAPHALTLMDAAADAALLSRAVARPVSVACAAGVEPSALALQPAALPSMDTVAGTALRPAEGAAQAPAPFVLSSPLPWAVRPSCARLLSHSDAARAAALPSVQDAGTVQGGRPARGLSQAGVDDLNAAQVFASESLWHEQALEQGQDPLDWRLRHLPEGPARDLATRVARSAPWPGAGRESDGRLHGRGFATACMQTLDPEGRDSVVWSAWVAEVAVHPQTGEIEVTRVVAGHDSQHLREAQGAGVHTQIVEQDAHWLAGARRLLGAPPAFDGWRSPAGAAPTDAPTLRGALAADAAGDGTVVRHGQLDLDGVATLPAAAAIANAIRHATGVRLREVPFQTEPLRLALAGEAGAGAQSPRSTLRRGLGWIAAGAAGIAGLAAMAWPMKPALPLTDGPDASLYSQQAIERGRLVAAAGDCVVCHTAPGGAPNAGGLGLETPFGTIYSTNITPDEETGIGRWSYAAFERAMRQGIHQDGRQLYPAFPYTAFAKLSDGDLQALYGYLMSRPAVQARPPETRLPFPYSLRPAMAGWNLLFHDATPFRADPARSAEWNRGAYLVEGAGHCAACHSPRNALGAEKGGIHYLGGGEAEGWSAPALDRLADGPRPWSRESLYQYLRAGFSARHGVAAGPMAPVIHGLAELPDTDVRAIATYLLELPGRAPQAAPAPEPAPVAVPAAAAAVPVPARTLDRHANGERIYQNACAVCHEAGSGPTLFGAKPQLALNTNLHAATPDNLVQVILHGIQQPANDALGYMPGFGDSLDDRQITDLLGYLRARFAPEEKAWPHDTDTVRRLRATAHAGAP
ncbi:c-type cytochrome [Paracidovorax citrulli]|uniref:c-type cytochrome n=1 Tax=Paracidovorax citrulli TaxID=80869 RepID=UPI001F11223E|nr:c-type cytochrome [Paracidovorax citrulli]UMT82087.1 c-type cytochrome [Paracidovorax citrulli]WIY30316.1 c-type cytochrome [Paracidovorax citrulli]